MPISKINTKSLQADAVTSAKIADGEIVLADIATGTIDSSAIDPNLLTGIDSDISASASTTRTLADGDSLLNSLIFGG